MSFQSGTSCPVTFKVIGAVETLKGWAATSSVRTTSKDPWILFSLMTRA